MKQYTEKRVTEAVGLLLKTLRRNFFDSGAVLDDYEEMHSLWERERSKEYAALVAGHFALKEIMDKMNKCLNEGKDG